MIKIYHNPRCAKSRAGLKHLESKGVDFQLIKYLNEPFTEATFTQVLKKLGRKPEEMLRKQEKLFKTEYKGKQLSDNEWITVMVQNPRLINRPIIETDEKAVWGNPPENIDELF